MDLKAAFRSLAKNPGFTLLALLVMALGMGANTAVFSVVDTVLLKPLAYRDADRIVTIRNYWEKTARTSASISAPDFHDWHDQSNLFDAMAMYNTSESSLVEGARAEYAQVTQVSTEFFPVFQIQPIAGRLFNADEQKPGSNGAAILSAAYAGSHFASFADAIGKTVRYEEKSLTVVGVMPPGFEYPQKTAVWYPENTIFPENRYRSGHNYRAIGRLKAGVSVAGAQAQMKTIATRLEQLYPASNSSKNVTVDRLRDSLVNNVRFTLYVLLGAVGLVLLIACANIANLLLARATGRVRELAIRAAVGASRGRLIRQMIVESAVLAIAAGAAGLALAIWGVRAIKLLAPGDVPRLADASIDGSVMAFTFGISLVCALLFGLAPALAASRIDLNETLKQGGTKSVIGGGSGRLRGALVVAEIALSVVLLTGAGLLVRSFDALLNVDLGFRPQKILVADVSVPSGSEEEGLKRAIPFHRDLLAAVRSLPGVISAGATLALPGNARSDGSYWIDHLPPPEQMSVNAPQAVFSVMSPGTLSTLGIPLKAGRDFEERDTYAAPFAVIINQALARQSFPGQDPIGRMLFCGFDFDSIKGMRIVGVAADVRQSGPDSAPRPEILMPYSQHPMAAGGLTLLARTTADPELLADAVRRKIQERDAEVPVRFSTMEAAVAEGVAAPRFRMTLLGLFAALATCLAMAGVYGVISYDVGRRSSEIGLRMALGAEGRDVLGMVLGQGLRLALIGLALGLAGALAATRLLRSFLFEVQPADPLTYVVVAAGLCFVALAACYIPARRAMRVDPLIALRQE